MADCVDTVVVPTKEPVVTTVRQPVPVVVTRTNTAQTTVQRIVPAQTLRRQPVLRTQVEKDVVVRVERGPQGPPGEAEGATFVATAAETIFGLRVVSIADGQVYHPDVALNADAQTVVGIALTSGLVGASITVRTAGKIVEDAWTWVPGPVYCGTDGALTQTLPAVGWLFEVARAESPTTLIVNLTLPIVRA